MTSKAIATEDTVLLRKPRRNVSPEASLSSPKVCPLHLGIMSFPALFNIAMILLPKRWHFWNPQLLSLKHIEVEP